MAAAHGDRFEFAVVTTVHSCCPDCVTRAKRHQGFHIISGVLAVPTPYETNLTWNCFVSLVYNSWISLLLPLHLFSFRRDPQMIHTWQVILNQSYSYEQRLGLTQWQGWHCQSVPIEKDLRGPRNVLTAFTNHSFFFLGPFSLWAWHIYTDEWRKRGVHRNCTLTYDVTSHDVSLDHARRYVFDHRLLMRNHYRDLVVLTIRNLYKYLLDLINCKLEFV